jgi:hypothetical protein
MGVKVIQTNFSSGELNPKMNMRVDTGAYANGAKKLRNVMMFNQGGVGRRSGTSYLATLAGQSRLVSFDFSYDERYVFAFSNTTLKIYSLSGTLLQTITGCPWTTAILFDLTFAQIADVMIICHPTMATQKITRTGASTFTRAAFAFLKSINSRTTYQPYYKFADDDVTLKLSATTGSVNITSSSAYFTSAFVGTRIKWFDTEINITAFTSSTVLVGTVQGEAFGLLGIDPIKTSVGSVTVEVTHVLHGFETGDSVTFSGINAVNGIVTASLNGAKTITVIDSNRYQYTAGATAATSSGDGGGSNCKFTGANLPSRNWQEQTFFSKNGYPATATFHESRLWFGGSTAQPNGLWSSKINEFFNFDIGDGLDNESIQVTIASDDISSVRHLVSNRNLQIFTANSEFYIPKFTDVTITPSNISINRQTPYGSSRVPPLPFDGATIYIQSTLKTIREFNYNSIDEAYSSPTLTLLADHLISSPKDMAISFGSTTRGEQYLLVVNDDGTIAQFISARAEKIAGWSLWETEGGTSPKFDSICSVGDIIYVSVLRGGSYFLEKFASDDLTLPIDCALSYTSGSAQTTWTVSSIYQGQTVDVISGNYYLGSFLVNGSNQITLNNAVTSITVGYTFTVEIETLPIELQDKTGSYSGRPKRISRVILDLNSTLSVSLSGNSLIIRQVTDDFSSEPTPVTGKKEFFLLGYNRDAIVNITQTEPLPLRVLGLSMEVSA